METCHALAARGHDVTLVVRPDTHAPAARSVRVLRPAADAPSAHRIARSPDRPAVAARRLPDVRARPRDRTRAAGCDLHARPRRWPRCCCACRARCARRSSTRRTASPPTWRRRCPSCSRARRPPSPPSCAASRRAKRTSGSAPTAMSRSPRGSRASSSAASARGRGWRSCPTAYCAATSIAQTPRSTDRTDRAARFTIGYAGHLYPWKGVDLVIEAVAALPDTRGLIVGGHEQEPDLARVNGLRRRQLTAPRASRSRACLPPAEVAARLREADVLALPNPASAISTRFTSPLKLFEYMASGRPIVASDLPSHPRSAPRRRERAARRRRAIAQALTAGIRRLRDDPALGARLARRAREDVARYTWERRAERLEALFHARSRRP